MGCKDLILLALCLFNFFLEKGYLQGCQNNGNLTHAKMQRLRFYNLRLTCMPHSHQGLNMFKSCLVKYSLKLFPSQKLLLDNFLSTTDLAQMISSIS